MSYDGSMDHPSTAVAVREGLHELASWHATWTVEKFHGDLEPVFNPVTGQIDVGLDAVPYETITIDHNLLMYGGVSCLWECLIGNGTATSAQTLTYFSEAEARLGVGDSAALEVATQTDLQASANKFRKAMEAGFPAHTDGTTSTSASCTWKASYSTAQANYAWNELALFNAAAAGRMLNRKVVSLGTKTFTDTWTLTLTITIT